MNIHRNRPMPLLGFMVAVLLCAGLASCDNSGKTKFHSIDITGADYAQDWAMPDASGKVRRLSEFSGKVVYVFFGFTHCPDVCPMTMVDMAKAKEQLGDDAEKLQIVFVTVDPERDTPQVLTTYLSYFDPDAIPLRGDADQLAAMAKTFKAVYQKVDGPTDDSYAMDHSAGGYIYDPQGKIRLYSRYQMPVDDLVADLQRLIHGE